MKLSEVIHIEIIKNITKKKLSHLYLSAHDWHCLLSCARAFFGCLASLLCRQTSLSLRGSSCLLSETFSCAGCGLSLPNLWASLCGFTLPSQWVSCHRKRSSPQNLKAPINFIVVLKACQQLGEFLASWTYPYLEVKGPIILSNERRWLGLCKAESFHIISTALYLGYR